MEKYRVKSLSVSGPGKKIYRYGETLTQENFNVPIQGLVDAGFLVKEDEFEKNVSRETPPIPDGGLPPLKDGEGDQVKTFDEWTKKELASELDKRGIEHDEKANKQELYDLWLADQKK